MKKFYESKTLGFALLTVVVGAASAFGFSEFVPDESSAQLIQGAIVIVVGVVNFVLRKYYTDTGIV